MVQPTIDICLEELTLITSKLNETPPLLLTHPAKDLSLKEESLDLFNFSKSQQFFSSRFRDKEWKALKKNKKKIC